MIQTQLCKFLFQLLAASSLLLCKCWLLFHEKGYKRMKVTWTKQFLKIVHHSPHKHFIVCKPTNTSPPTLAISVCQSPSVCRCVCPNNFPLHAKQTFFFSLSRFLQKYAIKLSGFRVCGPHLFLFRLLFPIWSLSWWRCPSLGGPSSSIPMIAFYLMLFKMQGPSWWDWKMWQRETTSAKSIELKWNYFSWGREPLHFTGLLNCLDAVRAYIF